MHIYVCGVIIQFYLLHVQMHTQSLLQSARGVTEKPFVVYPNSGEGWSKQDGCVEIVCWCWYSEIMGTHTYI